MGSIVKVISEKTAISIYLVVLLVGGVVWATTVKVDLDNVKVKQTRSELFEKEVVDRLARVETKQDLILEANKGKRGE